VSEQTATVVAPEAHEHGGVHDPGGHHSPEQIRKETRVYVLVFVGLLFLTLVTVGISYLHLPTGEAILIALAVASVKGFLVAGYFMHLLSEKKLIYSVLLLTVFFFLVLLWGPWHHHYDQEFFGTR
jgi:cytochrome c oxidase subunit 4